MVIWMDEGETAQEFIVSFRERGIIEEYRVNLTRKKFYKVRDFFNKENWGAAIRIIKANKPAIIRRFRVVPDPLRQGNFLMPAPFRAGELPLLEMD